MNDTTTGTMPANLQTVVFKRCTYLEDLVEQKRRAGLRFNFYKSELDGILWLLARAGVPYERRENHGADWVTRPQSHHEALPSGALAEAFAEAEKMEAVENSLAGLARKCHEKRRYKTDNEAKAEWGGSVYLCEICKGWHRTKYTAEQSDLARQIVLTRRPPRPPQPLMQMAEAFAEAQASREEERETVNAEVVALYEEHRNGTPDVVAWIADMLAIRSGAVAMILRDHGFSLDVEAEARKRRWHQHPQAQDVLRLVAAGVTDEAICQRLDLHEWAVENIKTWCEREGVAAEPEPAPKPTVALPAARVQREIVAIWRRGASVRTEDGGSELNAMTRIFALPAETIVAVLEANGYEVALAIEEHRRRGIPG